MNRNFAEMLFNEPKYLNIVKTTILCNTKGINEHDFKDCVSEVYLAVLRAKNLETHTNIEGWLNQTAKYVAYNFNKHLAKTRGNVSILDIDDEPFDETDFVKNIEDKLLCEEVIDLLKDNLEKTQYNLFKLKYIEDRPNKEIAEILGIKLNSVEVQITRLRKKIKKILENFK